MEKRFTFGVLNTSASPDTRLVFRAVVSPDYYKPGAWTFEAKENAARFDLLLESPTVAQRIAVLRLPLTPPDEPPRIYGGRSVAVDLSLKPDEKRDTPARQMLETMGLVDNATWKNKKAGLKRLQPVKNSCEVEAPPSHLQECALSMHFRDKEGHAVVVQHVTKEDERLGELTIIFLPDDPRGKKQRQN
jgi:hypothetical protein